MNGNFMAFKTQDVDGWPDSFKSLSRMLMTRVAEISYYAVLYTAAGNPFHNAHGQLRKVPGNISHLSQGSH